MKQKKANLYFFFIILILIVVAVAIISGVKPEAKPYVYSDIHDLFQQEKVDSFTLTNTTLQLKLKAPNEDGKEELTYQVADFSVFYNDFNDIVVEQYKAGILTDYDYPPEKGSPWWLMVLPYALIAAVFLIVWVVMMNKATGNNADRSAMKFSKARAKVGVSEQERVTFNDVAGADEEKAELQEIVDFLRDPDKYTRLGAKIPKGVLLVGPPGTGKTLIAKAVAGEAGVQFLSISGSDFVELYVGVGASRVRDLFEQAKKQAPAIIFIDEIDAVGRQRGAGLGGGHDEREQTLNQLLVEMDGFTTNNGVIVMAATNRADILDTALLRPGRFDRQVYVGVPDAKGRGEILRIHAKNKPLSDDVDLDVIARETSGFTGADLQNLMNEAALRAAKYNRPCIIMEDIQESMIKVIAGPEKKSRVVPQHERELTAYHEAGHAVAMYYLPEHDPVHQITIIPRGQAGGMTIYLPEGDRSFISRNMMLDKIVACLGGRVAEAMMMGDISTGASSDLEQGTSLARQMVTKYGMSSTLGPVSFDSSSEVFIGRDYGHTKSYSEEYAARIDAEVESILRDCYARCEKILTDGRDKLITVAEYLLEHETMDSRTFQSVMEAQPLTVDAPAEAEPTEEG